MSKLSNVKERPILMTPENAQKCHDGTKTQTRRLNGLEEVNACKHWDYPQMQARGVAVFLDSTQANPYNNALDVTCPYGVVGDRLWVREAHQFDPPDDGTWGYTAFMGCKGAPLEDIPKRFRNPEHCLYRGKWDGSPLLWRPSIHMPHWACRTVAEIAEVRVERLQDITEDDASAEGCESVEEFMDLWVSIIKSWEPSLWVWVIGFRRVVECNGPRRGKLEETS